MMCGGKMRKITEHAGQGGGGGVSCKNEQNLGVCPAKFFFRLASMFLYTLFGRRIHGSFTRHVLCMSKHVHTCTCM